MSAIIPGYEYDIFISYRQNDNKYDGWVTEFVDNLKRELEATIKEKLTVYFDENPHDGLHDHHDVDDSLKDKLKSLIFIPVVSQTYCDTNSFAWVHEFKAFIESSKMDELGPKIKLPNGNVSSRILPIKIHDLDPSDQHLFEAATKGPMRSIDLIYSSTGINRPLRSTEEHLEDNIHKTIYRDQINKVANAVKEIIYGIKNEESTSETILPETWDAEKEVEVESKSAINKSLIYGIIGAIILIIAGYVGYQSFNQYDDIPENLEKSIAVRPFINLSTDPEQQYFADGVMEDILTHLSQIEALRVTSRSSVEKYRDSNITAPEIGKELDVNYLLEGSVRKSGEQIMITTKLIRTGDDRQLWASNFTEDFSMEKLFEIQQGIAGNIVSELQVQISPEQIEDIVQSMSSNEEAYEHFVKGYKYYKLYTAEDNDRAIYHFRKAIEIDSTFGRAYGGLANSFNMLRINYGYPRSYKRDSSQYYALKGMQLDERCAECYKAYGQSGGANFGEMLERAITINPNYATGLTMLTGRRFGNGDYKGSFELIERLKTVNKGDFYQVLGQCYHNIGLTQTGLDCFKLMEKTQPFGTVDAYLYGGLLSFAGDSDAIVQYNLSFDLGGDSINYHRAIIIELTFNGKHSEVIDYYEENLTHPGAQVPFDWIVYNYYKAGRVDAIRVETMARLESMTRYIRKARYLSMLGQMEESLSHLKEAVDNGHLGDITRDRYFEPLFDNPEFIKLVEKQDMRRKEVFKILEDTDLPMPAEISQMVRQR